MHIGPLKRMQPKLWSPSSRLCVSEIGSCFLPTHAALPHEHYAAYVFFVGETNQRFLQLVTSFQK